MSYKIGVVGIGNVGVSYVYSLINQGLDINEIVLIDKNEEKAYGKALDLSHSLAFARGYVNKVHIGNYSELADADILCITAGVPQGTKKTSRMEDIAQCNKIIDEIMKNVLNSKFNGIIIVASNPLDVITYKIAKMYNNDFSRVIGSGTLLETARLKYEISQVLDFPIRSVSGYVFGEHGPSQFVAWSSVKINNTYDIRNYLTLEQMKQIEENVRQDGFKVAKLQGFTCYGVATALAKITRAIITNSLEELPVCTYDYENKIYISNLSVIGSTGVIKNNLYKFTEEEKKMYEESVNTIKDEITKL